MNDSMERIQNLLLGENVEMDTNHIAQVLQDKKLQKHLNTKIIEVALEVAFKKKE